MTDEHIERLREGDTLWPLARGIAQGILYPRACDSGAKCVLARYKSTAAPHVVRVNKLLHDYAGAKDESVPTALTSHGTLVAWFEQANVRLGKIAAYLESQFNALRGETGDFRKRSLLPNWTIDVYLDRINRALIAYEFVGQAGTGDGFNLDALSNLVLEGLRTNRTYDLAHVRSLVELVDEWLKKQQKRDEDIARIGDMIAQQCQQIVENARLDFDALQNGSVIDMLMLEHSRQERKGMLDVMVKYSAPYFPLEMQRLAQMVDNYCPAFDNLLGCGAGEIVGVSDQNKAELIAELQDISNSQGHGLDGNLHSTLEAEKSSLILCREVWGLPLLYYASLGTVYEAYEEDIQRADEYHIDWRETSENLPDIRVIDPQVYESIRENVEHVLFLMIVGIINCDAQGTYCISVDDWLGLGTDRFPLGSRLSRIIKKACEQQAIRNQMEKDRVDWEDKAAAKKWAMVYASCVLTYQHARTRVNWANTPQSFPLRNCFQILLEKVQQHLSDDQAGSLWHEFLRPKSASRDGAEAEAQFKATYQWLVDAGILCRVSPFVPIYQVDWRGLDQVELPAAGPRLQVKPPIE